MSLSDIPAPHPQICLWLLAKFLTLQVFLICPWEVDLDNIASSRREFQIASWVLRFRLVRCQISNLINSFLMIVTGSNLGNFSQTGNVHMLPSTCGLKTLHYGQALNNSVSSVKGDEMGRKASFLLILAWQGHFTGSAGLSVTELLMDFRLHLSFALVFKWTPKFLSPRMKSRVVGYICNRVLT